MSTAVCSASQARAGIVSGGTMESRARAAIASIDDEASSVIDDNHSPLTSDGM
ncbi:hypothetical protein D9M71_828630 [compost metagenome]